MKDIRILRTEPDAIAKTCLVTHPPTLGSSKMFCADTGSVQERGFQFIRKMSNVSLASLSLESASLTFSLTPESPCFQLSKKQYIFY